MSLDINFGTDFEANYTHNVVPMWKYLGCFEALYRSAGKTPKEILPTLSAALAKGLLEFPELEKLDSENGWGDAEGAMKFLFKVCLAAAQYPDSEIGVWS